jgi:hypothetical protein
MTKYADDPSTENARKAIEADRKVSDRSRAEYADRSKGKPTPTQEENDMAAHGAHILEHEADGSDPDVHNKSMEAASPSAPKQYQTKSAKHE